MEFLSILGFIIAWVFVVYFTFKGHSAIYIAIIGSAIIILLSGGNIATGITETYVPAFTALLQTNLHLFILGGILGQLYIGSGAANSIALALNERLMKNAGEKSKKLASISIIYFVGYLLCYGGVDTAAAIYSLVPLSLAFFQLANIPRRYVAAICVHISATCLCGWASPAFYNLYPVIIKMGTGPKAGALVGIVSLFINFFGGILLSYYFVLRDDRLGKGGFEVSKVNGPDFNKENVPNAWVALVPIIISMILFIVFDFKYVTAIGAGCILAFVLFFKNFKTTDGDTGMSAAKKILTAGAVSGTIGVTIINSMAAFGAIVKTTSVYTTFTQFIMGWTIPSPLMYIALVIILGIVTGAAISGFQSGLGIILEIEGKLGLTLPMLHRLGANAAATANLLPYSGIVFVALNLAGVTHKEGYGTILKIPVLLMLASSIIGAVIYTLFPGLV